MKHTYAKSLNIIPHDLISPESSDQILVRVDGRSEVFPFVPCCAGIPVVATGGSGEEFITLSWDASMVESTRVASKFELETSSKPNFGAIRIGLFLKLSDYI